MAFQASRWNDLCGWHRCCSDPDFSFNYWIYLAVLIMAMKSPVSLLFSCTPQPVLRPWDNVAIHAAVRYSFLSPLLFQLVVVFAGAIVGRLHWYLKNRFWVTHAMPQCDIIIHYISIELFLNPKTLCNIVKCNIVTLCLSDRDLLLSMMCVECFWNVLMPHEFNYDFNLLKWGKEECPLTVVRLFPKNKQWQFYLFLVFV